MLFSTVFLVQTAIALGNGQLHQHYGVSQKGCSDELYRTARAIESADVSLDSPLVTRADEFSKRLVAACYKNKIRTDAGIVGSAADGSDAAQQGQPDKPIQN